MTRTRLLLVRHAESESNVLRRLDTRPPGAVLTSNGTAQALRLAQGLALTEDDIILSSIATRAQQTARPLFDALGRDPRSVEGIHEIQAGDLENRDDHEAHRIYATTYSKWLHGDDAPRIPGGENGHDLMERYLPVIDTVHADYLDAARRIIIVSHGAAIRAIAARLTGTDPLFALRNRLENTGGVELVATGRSSWELSRWGTLIEPLGADSTPIGDAMG
ncbi:histidine phosphatase family protein [Lolliginicoccus suaedae]|uniref:histidine phosphatase family protein n=1 Tax=Lolliginicoccus suaedae TaxID=2605429 RepID=UPI0011EE243D|nr:histidine phosphatase family protein [Lolliginicoccus suaedae]